jgi:Flp pilus assembly protein TadG
MISKAKFKRFIAYLRAKQADDSGLAAVEAAMIFPILMTMLLGTFDLGNGILSNQKVIRASQVVADLVTRDMSIDAAGIDESINAGELALNPFPTDTFGVDIVSLRFDGEAEPIIVWRETRNMSENANVFTDVAALAEENSGVVEVTVRYLFEPVFSGFVVGDIQMVEKAFARGRRSAVVNLDE